MSKNEIDRLFNILCEEAKKINAWEALELIKQAQRAFACADSSLDNEKFLAER